MPISKIKLGKARKALTTAGMSPALAAQSVALLDLDKPLAPQIVELAKEDPELFGLDENGEPLPDEEGAEDDRPMSAQEAKMARIRGVGEHLKRKTYRRPADAQRPSTAGKGAREAADHLTKNTTKNTPPVKKWYADEPKPLSHVPAPTRAAPSDTAQKLAARLTGRANR